MAELPTTATGAATVYTRAKRRRWCSCQQRCTTPPLLQRSGSRAAIPHRRCCKCPLRKLQVPIARAARRRSCKWHEPELQSPTASAANACWLSCKPRRRSYNVSPPALQIQSVRPTMGGRRCCNYLPPELPSAGTGAAIPHCRCCKRFRGSFHRRAPKHPGIHKQQCCKRYC
jgi:hypothetical protein